MTVETNRKRELGKRACFVSLIFLSLASIIVYVGINGYLDEKLKAATEVLYKLGVHPS
jgi:hypothetical protein